MWCNDINDSPSSSAMQLLASFMELAAEHQAVNSTNALRRKMCEGIDEFPMADVFDRAEISGVNFACEQMQSRAKAKSCTAMVRTPADDENRIAIGEIRSFLRWLPPWGSEPEDALDIADVQWYGSKGRNAGLLGGQQVTRAFKSDKQGNLCLVGEIIPLHPLLVPHLQNSQWWQVLHLRLDF